MASRESSSPCCNAWQKKRTLLGASRSCDRIEAPPWQTLKGQNDAHLALLFHLNQPIRGRLMRAEDAPGWPVPARDPVQSAAHVESPRAPRCSCPPSPPARRDYSIHPHHFLRDEARFFAPRSPPQVVRWRPVSATAAHEAPHSPAKVESLHATGSPHRRAVLIARRRPQGARVHPRRQAAVSSRPPAFPRLAEAVRLQARD